MKSFNQKGVTKINTANTTSPKGASKLKPLKSLNTEAVKPMTGPAESENKDITKEINDIPKTEEVQEEPKNKKLDDIPEAVQQRMQRKQEEQEFPQLSITEFYCQYYDLIKEIANNILTIKYGNRLLDSLTDLKLRTQIEQETTSEVREYLVAKGVQPKNDKDMRAYIHVVFAEVLGYGILEYLLNDPEVDEVIVQSHDNIQAEIGGIIRDTEYKFPSYDAALGVARKIIQPLNKTLDFANPNVDGYLPDGSRLSASIPPLKADNDISITIRKFSDKVFPLSHYCDKFDSSTPEIIDFLEKCIAAKKTLIVSGGTGSGKTTLLNSVSFAIGDEDRIITIENTPELRIHKNRVEPYLTVSSNAEGSRAIEIRDIIIHALRKRPDRIVVGECRGGEIFEFLNAANTGHEGSMTSIHANSPTAAFDRMENMMLQNDETKNMTHDAILQVLASSVQLIVQTSRLDDGSRKIMSVTEVLGYGRIGYNRLLKFGQIKDTVPCNDTAVYLRDIFKFKEGQLEVLDDGTKIHHGQFLATGYIPTFLHELRRKGYKLDDKFFEKRILKEV